MFTTLQGYQIWIHESRHTNKVRMFSISRRSSTHHTKGPNNHKSEATALGQGKWNPSKQQMSIFSVYRKRNLILLRNWQEHKSYLHSSPLLHFHFYWLTIPSNIIIWTNKLKQSRSTDRSSFKIICSCLRVKLKGYGLEFWNKTFLSGIHRNNASFIYK